MQSQTTSLSEVALTRQHIRMASDDKSKTHIKEVTKAELLDDYQVISHNRASPKLVMVAANPSRSFFNPSEQFGMSAPMSSYSDKPRLACLLAVASPPALFALPSVPCLRLGLRLRD